jgi:hypothetical protein
LPTLVEGPSWGVAGTSGAVVLNPLRVENSIFSVVDRLLPGVISTTPHARYLGLHGFVRQEAKSRQLIGSEAINLMRSCEVVIAAVSHYHDPHDVVVPEAHGESAVRGLLEADGSLDVAKVSAKGKYSQAVSGFYGTYRGPEIVLGIIDPGPDQDPADRYEDSVVRPALEEVLELAGRQRISADELRSASQLCPCAARGDEAEWLREIVGGTAGGDAYAIADEARHDTARIIATTIGSVGPHVDALAATVRSSVSYGAPLDQGVYAGIELAEAWRGLMLRSRSVGAWRNLWFWIVRELSEPHTAMAIADAFAAEFPRDWTVSDLTTSLVPGIVGDVLLPVEEDLRAAQPGPHPLTELQLLAAGVRRLDELTGRAQKVLAGDDIDDLGPLWVKEELDSHAQRPLRSWAAELVERLLWRSQRIAMWKMDLRNPNIPRLPAQVIERDGVWRQQMRAGDGEPGMRIPRLISMLTGAGALGSDGQSWWLTQEGTRFL